MFYFVVHYAYFLCMSCLQDFTFLNTYLTKNTFCGTWYLPHNQVHHDRTVPMIMAGCTAHARNGRISISGLKSDVTIVFLNPDFL